MLRYVEAKVCFQEVPDEISLCINISGCKIDCIGCHSPQLAENIGNVLDWKSLSALVDANWGISCVAFMGGDSHPEIVNDLAKRVKDIGLKTAWYSGRQELSDKVCLQNFDFIKLGPYNKKLGPLTSKTTNQRFYKVSHTIDNRVELNDMTYKFWKQ